jgi:ABC-type Fe3+/spermidine/putrescine transport system ATPase subunit
MTTIYVTHDQSEALSMSDVIAVLRDGSIIQQGTPEEIYYEPQAPFVAEFIGSPNVLMGRIAELVGDGPAAFTAALGTVRGKARAGIRSGEPGVLVIRPEKVRVGRDAMVADNVFSATVATVVFLGEFVDCILQIGDQTLRARMQPELRLRPGEAVWVELPVQSCLILPGDDARLPAVSAALSEDERPASPSRAPAQAYTGGRGPIAS